MNKPKVRYDAVETYCYRWGVQPPHTKVDTGNCEKWIIRNLLRYKNCLMKTKKYLRNLPVFEKLFGKRNITVVSSVNESSECIVYINDKAVDRAKILILGS